MAAGNFLSSHLRLRNRRHHRMCGLLHHTPNRTDVKIARPRRAHAASVESDVKHDVISREASIQEHHLDDAMRGNGIAAKGLKLLDWPAICRQLACFCETSVGASVCLRAQIPIRTTLDRCQTLQNETEDASALSTSFDDALRSVFDVRPLLQTACSGPLEPGSRIVLRTVQLVAIARTLQGLMQLRAALLPQDDGGVETMGGNSGLENHARGISAVLQGLLDTLMHALDMTTCEALDRSSALLAEVRAKRSENKQKLQQEIDHWCRLLHQQGASELKAPVIRRDRLCCSVKRGRSGVLPKGSLTLATSQTGSTLYMEPKPTMQLNNAASELADQRSSVENPEQEEREEIKVLAALTAAVASHSSHIYASLDAVTHLDLARARAKHATWLQGVKPTLLAQSEGAPGHVHLQGVRHPLLLQPCLSPLPDIPTSPAFISDASDGLSSDSDLDITTSWRAMHTDSEYSEWMSGEEDRKVAEGSEGQSGEAGWPTALDLKVPEGARVVAVTGPNTGGKTATLKTLGVSVLMAQAGMYLHVSTSEAQPDTDSGAYASADVADKVLPNSSEPKVAIFEDVLADLGDSQSLQQSLSTFSGHMQQVTGILRAAGPRSLVLLDELGSGTDPSEGSALAIAILRNLSGRASLTFATTHYSEVKEEAESNPVFSNAAVAFDIETLKPLYRLVWGAQGASNALAVAQQLGFDRTVLADAKEWAKRLAVQGRESIEKGETMQEEILKQIAVSKKQKEEADKALAAATRAVDDLQQHLSMAEEGTAELQKQADSMKQQADSEVKKIKLLERQVHFGKMPVEEAIKQIETVIESLPKVANAQQRLLGIRMGADVRTLDTGTASSRSSGAGGAQEPEDWVPKVGEQVVVVKMGGVPGTVFEAPKTASKKARLVVDVAGLEVALKLSEVMWTSAQQPSAQHSTNQAQRRSRGGNERHHSTATQQRVRGAKAEQGEDEEQEVMLIQTSSNTIDLRGKRASDAMMLLEEELTEKGSVEAVFVIHGVGTGILRREVHQYLKLESAVLRYALEESSNGGCTVVHFHK